LAVLKRVFGVSYAYGGEEHSGWLPPGATTPLLTPNRRVMLDLAIEDDGCSGYLLVFRAPDDPSFGNDFWFENAAAAEAKAKEWFGIGPAQWQDA
jgi:hypothetical protein